MSSLQEAIIRPESQEAYLQGIPEQPRALLERLITQISGTLRLRLDTRNSERVLGALSTGKRVQREVAEADPMKGGILKELEEMARHTIQKIHAHCPDAFEPMQFGTENLWGMSLRSDMQHLINTLSPRRRVTVVADREYYNINGIIDYTNRHLDRLQLSGILVPFYELDNHIHDIYRRIDDIREYGIVEQTEGGHGDLYASGLHHDGIPYLHVPYKKQKSDRRRYCEEEFLPKLLSTNPDVVFLSNWKLILDEIVPEELERRGILLINCHPSVLPQNKGWRTELQAMKGQNPEASGFTYHYATKELDAGATILTHHYPAIPYDTEAADGPGGDSYESREETRMRLMMIRAQEWFTPRVLDYASGMIPQKVASGDTAFATEFRGRPEGEGGTYNRVLFKQGDKWLRLEEILGEPPEPENPEEIGPQRTYLFTVPCTPMSAEHLQAVEDIYREAEHRGEGKTKLNSVQMHTQSDGLLCTVKTASPTFSEWLLRMGYAFEIEEDSPNVRAPRKPNPHEESPTIETP